MPGAGGVGGEAVMSEPWKTAITKIAPNEVRVRGYDIADLMRQVSVGQSVYLILRGELPSDAVGRLMDAILVSSIDHGATPPSVLSARTVASTGATLSAAVSAGLSAINKHHGGAIEDCARHLGVILNRAGEGADVKALERAAAMYLDELKEKGQRMSGFGHRIHTADPRTARLFELADEAAVTGGTSMQHWQSSMCSSLAARSCRSTLMARLQRCSRSSGLILR